MKGSKDAAEKGGSEKGRGRGKSEREGEGGKEGGQEGGGKRRKTGQSALSNRGGPIRAHSGEISTLVRDAQSGVMVQVLGGGEGEGQQQQGLLAEGTLMDGFVGPQVRLYIRV